MHVGEPFTAEDVDDMQTQLTGTLREESAVEEREEIDADEVEDVSLPPT